MQQNFKKQTNFSKFFVVGLVLVLFLSNLFWLLRYLPAKNALQEEAKAAKTQEFNTKIFLFTKLFIEKVLNAQQKIDFETRLQLENSVRGLGDQEVLSQWLNFTNSQTEEQAQAEVRGLLELLMDKVLTQ